MPRETTNRRRTLKQRAQQAAFVLTYILEHSHETDGNGKPLSACVTAAASFDEGRDFCCAFAKAFPGKRPDPDRRLAHARLTLLLRRLSEAGMLERFRSGNPGRNLRATPKWQYHYRLPAWMLADMKRTDGSRIAPEEYAKSLE